MRIRVVVVAWCLCGGVAAVDAAVQSDTGAIVGSTSDETGAALPDVRITVTNDATALRREVTTGAEGAFTIPLLPPGRYTLRAEREGFAAHDIAGIIVNANQQVTLQVQLKVAGLSEAVMVTARRRTESQQDVPLSLVARTGEELVRARVNDLSQLERLVPGLLYGGLSVTASPVIIVRGVGSFASGAGVDASVGIAIDGAVTPQSSALASDFNDIERIEVLRGPQGTLFGKNSSAGLVNIVTKDPTETWTGSFDLGGGSYNNVLARGTVSGPVAGEKLLARIAFYTDDRGGYIYDIGKDRKVMDDHQRGARATFLYRPTAAARVRISAFGVGRDNDWAHSLMPVRTLGPLSNPVDQQLLAPIAGPTNATVWTTGDGQIDYYTQTWGTTVQWDQNVGNYALTSITSYLDWYWRQYWGGLTDTPAPYTIRAVNDAATWNNQWTQEVRIASPAGRRVDYVAGFYFYHLDYGVRNEHRFIPNPDTVQFNSSEGLVGTTNYAPFGEANVHVTRALTLTAGARWTHEGKDYYVLGRPPSPGTTGFLVSTFPGVIRDNAVAEEWSWRLGARWEPRPGRMFYTTAARGFKGYGFNAIPVTGTSQKVRPEIATTYEAGSKLSWLDNRVTANIAAYYSLFLDAQANAYAVTTSATGGGTAITFALANAGKLRSRGVEMELTASPVKDLTVNLTGAFIDAVYKDFRGAQCYAGQTAAQGCAGSPASQDLSGVRLPLSPRFSSTVSADYSLDLGSMPARAFMRGDYSWRDDVQYSYANAPNSIEPAYGLLGATVGVRSLNGRYTIAVYGKNLTDKFHVSGLGILSPGGLGTVSQQIGPDYRRMWGVTLTVGF